MIHQLGRLSTAISSDPVICADHAVWLAAMTAITAAITRAHLAVTR